MNSPGLQDGTAASPSCPPNLTPSDLPCAPSAPTAALAGPMAAAEDCAPMGRPLHESWHLTLLDPQGRRALYLRYSLLVTSNGFRKLAEVTGVLSERVSAREVSKCAIRQTHDISEYRRREGAPRGPSAGDSFRIGACALSENRASGSIRSKGKTLEWEINLGRRSATPAFELIPSPLRRSGFVGRSLISTLPDLTASGTFGVNGRKFELRDAFGTMRYESGSRSPHSEIRAHCNFFRDERGAPMPFVFQGVSFRGQILGTIPSPRFTSLCFIHQGRKFQFNSITDAIRMKSRAGLNDWRFEAEDGDLVFRGLARFVHQDFAGLSHEDTAGSLIYSSHSLLSDLEIQILRRGKLEAGLRADQGASIELIGRKKSLYVPLMA